MNTLQCKECGADLRGSAVEFVAGQARCRSCGAAYSGGRESRNLRQTGRQKAEVPLPPSVKVEIFSDREGAAALRVRVPWRVQHAQAVSQMISLGLIGLVGAICIELEQTRMVALLAMVATGLLLYALRFVNHTVIQVAQGVVTVRQAPIPWLSSRLDAAAIEQLYVDRRPLAQKRFDYNIRAKLHDADEIIFLRALSDPAVALYLEQLLEDHLHIVDRRVTGEFDPEQLQALQQQHDAEVDPGEPAASPPQG